MQYAFFSVPITDDGGARDELNKFLRSRRIISVHKQLLERGDCACWAFAVEYLGDAADQQNMPNRRKSKIDYREVLSEPDFIVYSRLRELRKSIAEAEGVPVYAVFTNDQLAEMVTRKVTSKNAMHTIIGVGEAKCDKYAERFLTVLKAVQHEAGGQSVREDR